MTERERTAINEALHELRRPLQALALWRAARVATSSRARRGWRRSPSSASIARSTAAARERPREPVRCEAPLRSAVRRWQARVALGGGSLELRWRAGEAIVLGDAAALEQAVDNLIVNAIEHGGPEIVVEGRRRAGRLVDLGRGLRRAGPRRIRGWTPRPMSVGRIAAGGRRGHGLALVRRFAASHGGRFVLHRADGGSVAILELPLVAGRLASDLAA